VKLGKGERQKDLENHLIGTVNTNLFWNKVLISDNAVIRTLDATMTSTVTKDSGTNEPTE